MNYKNRIVLFLDILGFKRVIDSTINKDKDGESDESEAIQSLYSLLSKMGALAGLDKPSRSSIVVTQFSDSIVISFSENEPNKSSYVFRIILRIIIHLIIKKIVCRGAISIGKLIHDKKILFGPALVEAYETETKAAMYPRVIMDKKIYDFSRMYTIEDDSVIVFENNIGTYLSSDLDGKYYIDYFRSPPEILHSQEKIIEYYTCLREVIIDGLKSAQPDLKVKYGWMKAKYNSSLNHFKSYPIASKQKVNEYFSKLKSLK